MEDSTNPYAKKLKQLTSNNKEVTAPPSNPYQTKIQEIISKPKEDPDSFSNTVGNLGSYLGSLFTRATAAPENYPFSVKGVKELASIPLSYDKKAIDAIPQIKKNVVKTASDIDDSLDDGIIYLASTPLKTIGADGINKVKEVFKSAPGMGTMLGSMAGGALDMFVQQPLEAITQQENDHGVAKPMTPEQLALKYQAVAGTMLMGKVAKNVAGALLPTEFANAESALAAQKVSRIGKLAKVVSADAVAGASSGAVQGTIAGLGQDNDLEKSLIGAITFAPIGAAFGLFGLKKYSSKIDTNVGKLVTEVTAKGSRELAALNSLRTSDNTTMADLAVNIDAINTSDDLLNAAIKAKLKIGQGYVVENFEKGEKLPEIPGGYAYHSDVNNSLLASPVELDKQTETFFNKTGFVPLEVVNFGGNDNYIVGSESKIDPSIVGKVKRVKIRDVSTGQESVVPIESVRRTNTSVVSSSFNSSVSNKAGSTRFYHGGAEYDSGPRWVSPDKKYAEAYARKSGDKGFVHYIDIPNSHPLVQDAVDVSGTNMTSPKSNFELPESMARSLKPLTSSIPELSNPEPTKVTKLGILNPENFLDRAASGFTEFYKKASGRDSFDNLVAKYAQKASISAKDLPYFSAAIYKRIGADLSTDLLSPKEQAVRLKVRTELEEVNKGYVEDLSRQISQAAFSNNMIIDSDGQGRYDIKFRDGTSYATVGSPEDALKVINTSGQVNGNPLDGGGSGVINTSIGNLGGMSQPFQAHYGTLAKWADRARLGAIGRGITPAPRWLTLFDNVSNATSLLQDVVMPIQQLLADRKNFVKSNDHISVQLNKTLELSKSFSESDLMKINDNVKTMSADEIRLRLLYRPMLGTETQAAGWFKGISVKDVTDLLYSTKSLHGFSIGSPEFTEALALVGKNYSPKVLRAARNISVAATQMPPDLFSPYAVIRLAKALEDPATALTRDQHSSKYLTPEMKRIADEYTKLYNMYDIDPKQKLAGYVPDIAIYNAVGGKGVNINPTFARELSKVGVTPRGNLISSPIEQALKYHYSYLNTKSGFMEGMDLVNKAVNKNINILSQHPDPSISRLASPLKANLESYLNSVMGVPSHDEILSQISSMLTQKMGLRTPDVGSLLDMFSLSNIAMRPGLAIRDVHNALGAAYIDQSLEFAEKAFTYALSTKVMEELQDKGVIPRQDAQSVIDPFKAQNILGKEGPLGKASSWSFKASGQEDAYNRTAAGIYMATRELGANVLRDLQSNKIDKAQAYKRLHLFNHGPAVQTAFDNLISAGKPDEALDFLGRWNVRTISTVFGSGNTPIGWNSPWGRLLGQYGNWSANASNSLLERMTYGDKEDIAARMLRTGIVVGATSAAGAALGVDLHTWQFANPLEVMPGVGPVATVMKDAVQTYGHDDNAFDAAMNSIGGAASNFVPFSKAVRDWSRAMDQNNIMAGILAAPPAKQ